jgi:hypothetical protein
MEKLTERTVTFFYSLMDRERYAQQEPFAKYADPTGTA